MLVALTTVSVALSSPADIARRPLIAGYLSQWWCTLLTSIASLLRTLLAPVVHMLHHKTHCWIWYIAVCCHWQDFWVGNEVFFPLGAAPDRVHVQRKSVLKLAIWASWNLHVLAQESFFFSFLISRIDYSSFFNMNSPKNFTCLSAKLRKEFSSLLGNPPAPCYRKLKLSLYAMWQQELTNTCTCNYSTLHRNI